MDRFSCENNLHSSANLLHILQPLVSKAMYIPFSTFPENTEARNKFKAAQNDLQVLAQTQALQPLAIQPQELQPQALQPQALQPQELQPQAHLVVSKEFSAFFSAFALTVQTTKSTTNCR
jgi:hypothetical protein